MKCKPLTKAEKKWLEDLQSVLDQCPSKRMGFFTIGDPNITVIDQPATDAYEKSNPMGRTDEYCHLVSHAGTELGFLNFPGAVASTCG